MRRVISLLIYLLVSNVVVFATDTKESLDENLGHAVVLTYHRFGNSKYKSTNIKLEQFEQHLQYLQDNNYTVWPLSKVISTILEGKKFPPKTVAITVDDAYKTTYTNAYPRLKAKKFPFTVFVSTHSVDVKSKNYMSWDNMREMSLNGGEFANHSLNHPAYMTRGDSESREDWERRARKEIEKAQTRLQKELGATTNAQPKLFSYPFGEYNQEVADLLKELDYVGVVQTSGVVDASSDLRAVPRFPMSEIFGTKKGFILKVNTLPLAVKSITPRDPLVGLQNPPLLNIKLQHPIINLGCFTANGDKMDMEWVSKTELNIKAKSKLKGPRDRYTCTAPAKDGRWYWYSHLWIIKE